MQAISEQLDVQVKGRCDWVFLYQLTSIICVLMQLEAAIRSSDLILRVVSREGQ